MGRIKTRILCWMTSARSAGPWYEADEMGATRAWMIRNLLEGQYKNPVRIVAFNTAEGWPRDVTTDIADELRRRYMEYDRKQPRMRETRTAPSPAPLLVHYTQEDRPTSTGH
jgi:hypothetical protein